jgi:hypothetical protein
MGKSGKVDDDAQLLYRLADQLFASPLNVVELIEQGGVSVLHKAADRALQELRREHCDSAALTLLLQVRRAGSPAKRRHDHLLGISKFSCSSRLCLDEIIVTQV